MRNSIENIKLAQDKKGLNHTRNGTYILGRWDVAALKTMQESTRLCFVPTVKAAASGNDVPEKPPPMKYQDLPLYDCPHMKYQNFEADKNNFPNQDVKILNEMLLPSVKEYRKNISNALRDIKHEMVDTCKEISGDFRSAERQFLTYMRDPANKKVSWSLMGAAALIGCRIGKTWPRRLFASGLALFVTGSICFPEKTDQATRTLMFQIGKAIVPFYNLYFGTDWVMRERMPCPKEIPEIPTPAIKPYPGCEQKKK